MLSQPGKVKARGTGEGEGKEEEDSDRFGIGDGRAGEWESFRRDRWWEYTQIRQFVNSHSMLSLCFVETDRGCRVKLKKNGKKN